MQPRRLVVVCMTALVLAAVSAAPAAAHDGQHGTDEGHLLGTGESGKIEFVDKVEVSGAGPELIADVAVDPDHDFAYLANWGSPDCPLLEDVPGNEAGGRTAPDAGVWVVDISDLDNPEEVAFIPMSQDTRPGEGLQVIHIETAEFTGDVLAVNEESCGKNFKAGFSLWDVTDPTNPVKLAKNFGDFTTDGAGNTPRDANQTHSVFMWTTGENAYLVAQDEMESADVDIFDITDPKHPVLIAEVDANEFDVDQPDIFLTASFHHDVVVKEIEGRWIMLVSYWDGGWVLLDVTDPANPVFIADTDYAAGDPLLLEERGVALPPEGNAHQAEFTIDNRFIIGTDEDFNPFKLFISIAGGAEQPVSAGTATPVADDVPGHGMWHDRARDDRPRDRGRRARRMPLPGQDRQRDSGRVRRDLHCQQRDRRSAVRSSDRDARRHHDPGVLREPVGRLRDPRHRGLRPGQLPGRRQPGASGGRHGRRDGHAVVAVRRLGLRPPDRRRDARGRRPVRDPRGPRSGVRGGLRRPLGSRGRGRSAGCEPRLLVVLLRRAHRGPDPVPGRHAVRSGQSTGGHEHLRARRGRLVPRSRGEQLLGRRDVR